MPVEKYIAPSPSLTAFHCPSCSVLSMMNWARALRQPLASDTNLPGTPMAFSGTYPAREVIEAIWIAECSHCHKDSVWRGKKMIFPVIEHFGPPPTEDMPKDIASDFEEARAIAGRSPRGAAALVRLCIQKLCKALGEKGDNINEDIGNLVKKGLDAEVQQALDAVRVIGNNAVHPGTIDLKDDPETAERLMEVVNYVVDALITQPKKRKALFGKVPPHLQAAIAKRDGK